MPFARRVPTKPKPLTDADAMSGAAWRVIVERVGNPQNYTTSEQLAGLSKAITDIRNWSRTQDAEVAIAYEAAAVMVLKDAQAMVENTRRAKVMMSLYTTMPKPPAPEPKAA